LARTCRGVCVLHKGPTVPNGLRYGFGQKRCTYCGLFLSVKDTRCPCCKAVLRTKPRSKKKTMEEQNNLLKN